MKSKTMKIIYSLCWTSSIRIDLSLIVLWFYVLNICLYFTILPIYYSQHLVVKPYLHWYNILLDRVNIDASKHIFHFSKWPHTWPVNVKTFRYLLAKMRSSYNQYRKKYHEYFDKCVCSTSRLNELTNLAIIRPKGKPSQTQLFRSNNQFPPLSKNRLCWYLLPYNLTRNIWFGRHEEDPEIDIEGFMALAYHLSQSP